MKSYDMVCAFVTCNVWALLPEKFKAISGLIERKQFSVEEPTFQAIAKQNRQDRRAVINNSVAVLPIYGVISQRMNMLQDFSGGTSTEQAARDFDALVRDDTVKAIVLDLDSPGGNYAGTMELADKIFQARGIKPIIAVSNSMAASAAYWLASAADEIVCTPSGEVGSIGVVAVHYDVSKANEAEGVKPTYVTFGQHKAELNPDSPPTAEALQELQRRVNEAGGKFENAVARNRAVSPQTVRTTFGQGRMFSAEEAVRRGMADRVGTLEQTIGRLQSSTTTAARSRGVNRVATHIDLQRKRLNLEKFR